MMAGFVYDMNDATYHADPVEGGSLSSTFARLLTNHVPVKALDLYTNRKPTKAMNLGKAAHRQALGSGPTPIVWEFDGRTTAGKAERAEYAEAIAREEVIAVTDAEYDQITGMADALRRDPVTRKMLDISRAEVSAFWKDGAIRPNAVWLRARYDLLSDEGAVDYKTTQDVSMRGFSKAMATYGYHQQAEFYWRGLEALGHPAADKPFRFVCQETTPPYLIQIHRGDVFAMQTAELLNDRAVRLYAECAASGEWPGYPTVEAPDEASLPAYYFYGLEHALPDGYTAFDDQIEASA